MLTGAAAVEDVLDSAVALSVKEALDDAGIEIPFPQRVVHLPAEP